MLSIRATVRVLALSCIGCLAGEGLAAQAVPGEAAPGAQAGPGGWAPPSLGVRFGYENQQRENSLGGQLRIPVVPRGQFELMASMDVTFLANINEYQYNFEGVYVLGGRAGGLYGGGGLGLRNTIFPNETSRSTEMGYTAVVGFRLVGLGLIVPQLEYRWVFINEAPVTYQLLSIGLNIAVWQPVRQPG